VKAKRSKLSERCILQANCWFMVSLIQECLGEVFFGCLAGRFMYTVLGDTIRRDIMTRARLIIGFPHLEPVRILHQLNIPSFLMVNTCIHSKKI